MSGLVIEFQGGPAHGKRDFVDIPPYMLPVHVREASDAGVSHRTIAYRSSGLFTRDGAMIYVCTNPYERRPK